MATKSRAQRKVELQRLIKTEFGRLQVREKLGTQNASDLLSYDGIVWSSSIGEMRHNP